MIPTPTCAMTLQICFRPHSSAVQAVWSNKSSLPPIPAVCSFCTSAASLVPGSWSAVSQHSCTCLWDQALPFSPAGLSAYILQARWLHPHHPWHSQRASQRPNGPDWSPKLCLLSPSPLFLPTSCSALQQLCRCWSATISLAGILQHLHYSMACVTCPAQQGQQNSGQDSAQPNRCVSHAPHQPPSVAAAMLCCCSDSRPCVCVRTGAHTLH